MRILAVAYAPLPEHAGLRAVHGQLRTSGEPKGRPAVDIQPAQMMRAPDPTASNQARRGKAGMQIRDTWRWHGPDRDGRMAIEIAVRAGRSCGHSPGKMHSYCRR